MTYPTVQPASESRTQGSEAPTTASDAPQVIDKGGVPTGIVNTTNSDSASIARANAATLATFEATVPTVYREREWYKNITKAVETSGVNPQEELIKQFENAQSLVGSRKIEPLPADATPEQKKEFYKNLGVPDDVKAYVVPPTQWSDDEKEIGSYIDGGRDPVILEGLAKWAQENGVTPEQLKGGYHEYEKILAKQHKEMLTKQKADSETVSADWEKISLEKFGNRRDQVMNQGGALVKENAPDWAVKIMENPTSTANQMLVAFAATLDSVRSRYIREASVTREGAPATTNNSFNDVRAEVRKNLNDPAYNNPRDPRHAEVVKRVKDLEASYSQIVKR